MKKLTRKAFLLWVLYLFVSACAPVHVTYDYERSTNFSTYTSYNYYDDMNIGMSELDSNRLLDALDDGLQAKGLRLSERPDFLINIKSSTFQENRHNNVGVGVGGGGGHVGGGISLGIPIGQTKVNRDILFEFVDDTKTKLFWQAESQSAYQPNAKPAEREKQFKTIVDKVLSGYPPKSKK